MRQQGSNLRPDMRLPIELLHGQMKACGAIYTIPVEQRHRWHLMGMACLGQLLGNRRSFEEAEC
jgi:hypothetical protein